LKKAKTATTRVIPTKKQRSKQIRVLKRKKTKTGGSDMKNQVDLKQLREIDIQCLCGLQGFKQDANDPRQYKKEGYRITIKGFAWYDHEASKGGGGAINLVMHLMNCTFNDAVEFLASQDLSAVTLTKTEPSKKQASGNSYVPVRFNDNLAHVMDYLTIKRGINPALVKWCVDKGIIYADGFKNCVFLYGANGCELRGTSKIKWRAAHGRLEQPFLLPCANTSTIAIVENAIDALSYRQIHKSHAVAAIGGNANKTIMTRVVELVKSRWNLELASAFDNDIGGETAHAALLKIAEEHGIKDKVYRVKPMTKDWNEDVLSD
jgi:hypothetical protein